MKFIVDERIFEKFPGVRIGVVVGLGIDNSEKHDKIADLSKEWQEKRAEEFKDIQLSTHERIAPWREAYSKFGVKPSKYSSSIEALLKRVAKGETIPEINSIVDLYNAMSLKHLMPFGAEDLDKVRGDIKLTFARGDETGKYIGSDEVTKCKKGEVTYLDDLGFICRRWNWREADRTKLTEETKNFILVAEALLPADRKDLQAAVDDFVTYTEKYLGGVYQISVIDESNPSWEVDFTPGSRLTGGEIRIFEKDEKEDVVKNKKVRAKEKKDRVYVGVAEEINVAIKQTLQKLKFPRVAFELEHPAEESHGDYATNVALKLAGKKKGNFLENIEWIFSKVRKDNFEKVTPRSGLPVGKLQPQVKKAIGAKSELVYLKPRIYAKIRDWWRYWKGHPEITQEFFYLLPAALYFPQQVLKAKSAINTYLFVFNFKHIFVIVVEVEKKPEGNQIKTIHFVQARRLKFFKAVFAQKKGFLGRRRISSLLAPRQKAGVAGAGLSGLQESQVFYNTIAKLCQENILDYEEKVSPKVIAERITQELQKDKELAKIVSKIEVAGPGFINFWLSESYLVKEIKTAIKQSDKYGSSGWGKGNKWLIEHTSPNPNKAMHLGHLRNNVTGMAIANIWEFLGIDVIRDDIDNNRGIAIAKLMWGYLKFAHKEGKEITDIDYWYEHQGEWQTPEELRVRPDKFVDELYVKASEDVKNDKEVEKKVKEMVVDWENEDKKNWALWKKVLQYSYQGQAMTLKRLGNKWDKVWHEHEHYKKGKGFVEEGLEKGIFRKLDDGAVLSDLKEYGLTDTILIKSDGSALYITQDLALTKLKRDTFHPDRLFWVIGPDQSLALKQLFAICEQLEIGKLEDFTHIAYGYMSIKGKGKMSSRLGTVVYIDELIDAAKDEIVKKIDKDKFSKGEIDNIAEVVALGAVKYSILKVGRTVNTAFDFGESLNFEGNSGPYLQYTYARAKSVLRKSQIPKSKSQTNYKLQITNYKPNTEELTILRTLYKFPETVFEAGKTYSPNLICNFLFDLAQRYNSFYNKHKIIRSESEKLRLMLTAATAQVLKNGLTLLGIKTLEKM